MLTDAVRKYLNVSGFVKENISIFYQIFKPCHWATYSRFPKFIAPKTVTLHKHLFPGTVCFWQSQQLTARPPLSHCSILSFFYLFVRENNGFNWRSLCAARFPARFEAIVKHVSCVLFKNLQCLPQFFQSVPFCLDAKDLKQLRTDKSRLKSPPSLTRFIKK